MKKAAPLLVNVAFFICFFWLVFAIIGVQSFKSSLRRTCVWINPDGGEDFAFNQVPDLVQHCGGYIENGTGAKLPWIHEDGTHGAENPKGYLCPVGSLCVEGTNPYSNTVSFDNIFHSLQLVFVIMSSNTFTDIMYYTTDSDYLTASLFFVFGFITLSLWLVNLLVAVITSSFQVIREEGQSAFKSGKSATPVQDEEKPRKPSKLKRIYDKTYWFWLALIAFGLVSQCFRSSSMGPNRTNFIRTAELVVTIFLAIEIFLRFVTDWRHFHRSKRNWLDLFLAVVTIIIQIPHIRDNRKAYMAMTIFQILRIYRLVLAFSVTRDLIETVFSNVAGLLNLVLFVGIITLITAIFAIQLFRNQIPREIDGEVTPVGFFDMWNSFIGMYQILSSEDWTSIMYTAQEASNEWNTAWITAMFFIMWFILSNFIVLNMFIAVIQESFDVSEDDKRLHQVKAFLQQKQANTSNHGNVALSSILKRGNQRHQDPLDRGPAALEMLMKHAVVQEFLDDPSMEVRPTESHHSSPDSASAPQQPGFLPRMYRSFKGLLFNREPNPFYSKLKFSHHYDELDPTTMAKEVISAAEERKRAQRQYLQRYPKYNVSLFLFTPDNPVRRACQRIVGPGRGDTRIEGVDPSRIAWYAFSTFIYAAIVAMVAIACITTPIYQREFWEEDSGRPKGWFVYTDIGFALIFTVEAAIKIIADGAYWTPNAYFRGAWGLIDAMVLVTLWINVIASFYRDVGITRFVGAFKALRALRLLNVSDSARKTFHAVIIMGGWKVISVGFIFRLRRTQLDTDL